MTKRIAIVDADSICYRSAAASEKRSIVVTHLPTGIEKEFSNRTEFKDLLKSKNKLDKVDDYLIKDKQEPEPLANCLHTVKMQIERIEEVSEANEMLIIVGGKSSYRENLPLPTRYKSTRENMLRPIHLKEAKNYLINKHSAKEVNIIEADDAVMIEAYSYKGKGYDVIISSIDKDNRQAEDFYVYDYSKSPSEGLYYLKGHSVEKGKNKLLGSGVGFLSSQLLLGDLVDVYKPTEIVGIKYGMMSAFKDLSSCKEPSDFLEVVRRKYKEWYPEPVTYTAWDGTEHTKDWKGILQMYFKCAYMLRSREDKADAEEFFDKYGVTL